MSSDVDLTPGTLRLDNLTKRFEVHRGRGNWRNALPGHQVAPSSPVALDGLTLHVDPGEVLGIIGPNGAGKSTLLKLVAGILAPTSGTIRLGGRVGSMIELGIGFHPDLTGWENLEVGGMLLGLTREQIGQRAGEMVEFAGLEDAMTSPVKHFSTGMTARLGFALATHAGAAILAVDEVLSVGDRVFQERCIAQIRDLSDRGCTILFVSHEMSLINLVCDRTIRLGQGRVIDEGPSAGVIDRYLGVPTDRETHAEPPMRARSLRLSATTLDPGDPLELDLELDVDAEVETPLDLAIELTIPSIAPGVFGHCTFPLPAEARGTGTHRLLGRTSPLHIRGGVFRSTVAVRSGLREQICEASADFDITGSNRMAKPLIFLHPTARIEPIDPPEGADAGRPMKDHREPVARARKASKHYRRGTPRASFRRALPGRMGRSVRGGIAALDDLDLDLRPGEVLGLIGPNGAGKSTLLKALAGLFTLDGGAIRTTGRVVAVLELGVGFHGDMTGSENLELSSMLYGMTSAEFEAERGSILDLAGIGDAIDRPVKHYSTGMRARLGLALALHVPSEILLIDELLSVGDQEFRLNAIRSIKERAADGAAVVVVSHDLRVIATACDRVCRLEAGCLVDEGPPSEVLARYGGTGWTAGLAIGTGPIRLHDLRVRAAPGDRYAGVHFTFLLEVTAPAPHSRLELSFRDPNVSDRSVFRTPETIERVSGALEILVDEGDLPGPGWYAVSGTTGRAYVDGRFDLTIAAVDARSGDAEAEVWKLTHFGDGRATPRGAFDAAWEVVGSEAPDEGGAVDERNETSDPAQQSSTSEDPSGASRGVDI